MLDFPNSPTVGATYTGPGGVVWTFDGAKWASGSGAMAPTFNDVGRNLIHNPLFNIAQRGAGPFTTNVYTLDRWAAGFVGGSLSVTQGALADADRTAIGDEAAEYALQSVVVGGAPAASMTLLQHPIEDVRRLSGKTVTVSFWARAASGTPKIGVDWLQYFGSGGSPSAAISTTGTAVTISATWTRYAVTMTIPSAAGKVLGTNNDHSHRLQIWFSSGTTNNAIAGGIGVQSGTFSLWGVQCEIGPTATPLEKPDPQQDLAKCQRFYQQAMYATVGNATAGSYLGGQCLFPVPMRAAPTIVVGGAVGADVNVSAANAPDMIFYYGFRFVFTATATASMQGSRYFTASADL